MCSICRSELYYFKLGEFLLSAITIQFSIEAKRHEFFTTIVHSFDLVAFLSNWKFIEHKAFI